MSSLPQEDNHEPNITPPRQREFDWNRRAGPIFKWGIMVAFLLILLGVFFVKFSLANEYLGNLIVCVGLGIILGAFGSTASLNLPTQGIVLTGVAVLSVVLFKLIITEMNNGYLRVRIGSNIEPETQMLLRGDQDFLGSYQRSGKTYDFVIFGTDIRSPHLSLAVSFPDKTESIFDCISLDKIKPYLASGKMIEWHLNASEGKLVNDKGEVFASLPCQGRMVDAGSGSSSLSKEWFWQIFNLLPSALAADTPEALIEQLDSEAINVRQDARSQLSKLGIDVINPLLAGLSKKDITYRSQLGIIVALTEMMRDNKKKRTEIIQNIPSDDLVKLVDATANEDRTIRVYASEFLYDLGDPRTIELAFDRFSPASENGRYNLLFVIKGAVPYSSTNQKQSLANKVISLKSDDTPETNELIDSIVNLAQ
ncbi:HEAT repeat domain-containing protein [Methylomicrobium lacus]|uniref:HEAT repeat domain-containing protein n=1 Tax=Methylomicrobium lacus TaxID=136992 RepID=UPI0004BCF910|nr:hypothetical protein [Methylomicrobium lacus]